VLGQVISLFMSIYVHSGFISSSEEEILSTTKELVFMVKLLEHGYCTLYFQRF